MKRVTVTAIRGFEYEGQPVPKGVEVDMIPIDASLFARSGHVSLTRVLNNRQLVAEGTTKRRTVKARPRKPANLATGSGRRYRRTDMTGEP